MIRRRPLVAYSQFQLASGDVYPVLDPSQPVALAQVTDAGRGLIVLTGIAMGHVVIDVAGAVALEKTQGATAWEERQVVEMDVVGPLWLSSPTILDDFFDPVFTPSTPGRHTVTVLARGRNTRPGESLPPRDDEPFEEYLVHFAPG